MGQYYKIVNLDKRESICPHHFGDGAKILEFGHGGLTMTALAVLLANSNGRGGGDLMVRAADYKNPTPAETANQIRIDAVSGRWAGDRIVVAGDYAEETDRGEDSKQKLYDQDYVDISTLCINALAVNEYLREQLGQPGYLADKYVAPLLAEKGPVVVAQIVEAPPAPKTPRKRKSRAKGTRQVRRTPLADVKAAKAVMPKPAPKVPPALTAKQVDDAITAAWFKHAAGVQVMITALPAIFRELKEALAIGMDLEFAVKAAAVKYGGKIK